MKKFAIKQGAMSRLRLDGIVRHWLVNILSVVVIVVTVVEIFLGIFIRSFYYDTARSSANELCQGLSLLATVSADEFRTVARQYVENFESKDQMEVQVMDSSGTVLYTSNGFEPSQSPMADYTAALAAKSHTAYAISRTDLGEPIMAQTTILGDYGNGSNGAVRWVISLKQVNKNIAVIVIICILIGLGIILFTAISGLYFVQSIVRPVQKVSDAARKIAMGDFNARIDGGDKDEIGELCDTINYMASELSQSETLKNNFISSVSHELRTPLTAIKGWGETAKMAVGSNDELVHKGLDVVLTESERLTGLVEDLLDFSRMQSGRLSVHKNVIQLGPVVQEAAAMYAEVARKNNLEFTVLCPETLPPVMGDAGRLKQVFINIIDNAIKYSTSGGHVLIDVHEEESCLYVKVSDTGVGIPEQDIDRVKEKFFKSNTTVRGSGIGLAVADEIMKQHNGLLFLESKENVGTTVTAVLPVYLEKAQPTETESV